MRKLIIYTLALPMAVLLSVTCKKKTETPASATPAPVASFSYTTSGPAITFTSTSSNNPSTLTWYFGDGDSATGSPVTHTYTAAGSYSVKLTAANSSGKNSASQSITMEILANIHTRYGDMLMWLYNEAPLYKKNFTGLADTGFYDSTTFHRLVPDFVIQGGDPNSKQAGNPYIGDGGPGYNIPFLADTPLLSHVYGAVGAASTGPGQPGNGSQFYIVVNPQGDHSLDGLYPVFGLIINGMNVAVAISNLPNGGGQANMALERITMTVTDVLYTDTELKSKYGFTVIP